MKSTTIIYVSPVPRTSAQGRDKRSFHFIDPVSQRLEKGNVMGQNKESGAEARYMFQPLHNQGKYRTGLDEKITNPFKDLTVDYVMNEYNLPLEWRIELEKIVSYPEITKQSYYEILHGQVPGFYKTTYNAQDSIFTYYPGKQVNKNASYIATFVLTLYDRANRFTDETPRGAMAIQLIKNHSKIAPDKKSVNPVQHDYYISEENEAEMEKMRKQDIIDEAMFEKIHLQRNATDYKNYQVASMCTTVDHKPIVKGVTTREQVKTAFNNYLGDGRDQMKNIDKFLEVIDLLKSPETKDLFEVKYLVGQGYINGVLGRRDGYTFWYSKSNEPSKYKWTSDTAFINFILTEYNTYNPDEQGQNWYIDLLNEVKAKGARIEQ